MRRAIIRLYAAVLAFGVCTTQAAAPPSKSDEAAIKLATQVC